MDIGTSFQVFGVGVSVLIAILVQFAKAYGFPSKYSPMLSIGLGMAFGVIAYLSDTTAGSLMFFLVSGFVQRGLASGAYSIAKHTYTTMQETSNPLPPVDDPSIDPNQPDGKIE